MRGGKKTKKKQAHGHTLECTVSYLCNNMFVITNLPTGLMAAHKREAKQTHMCTHTHAHRCLDKETPCDFIRPTRSIGAAIHK